MFHNPRYITKGALALLSPALQNLLWYMIEAMPVETDRLQVFQLSQSGNLQTITHTQEVPSYTHTVTVDIGLPVNGKVYCIDDKTHSTMLLAEEY